MALPAFSASVLLLMKMPGALTLQGLFGFAEMSDQSLLRLWLLRRESMVSMQNTGFCSGSPQGEISTTMPGPVDRAQTKLTLRGFVRVVPTSTAWLALASVRAMG